jgi:hypothetical protein
MKNTLKILVLVFLMINMGCKAQMVKTTKDVYLLKTNEQLFLNKPLKDLLKEIKPEIKTADGNIGEGYQYFSFWFRTKEQLKKNESDWEDRVALFVYVKEPIDWKYEKRPKGNELLWTKEDAEKYGNLTVTLIKVINQPKE